MPFDERRKYPRVPESISCWFDAGTSAFTGKTTNLSCGGALCQLPRSIPPLTQLEIALELPATSQEGIQSIRCMGVVVRQESQPSTDGAVSYLTAIFFSNIKQEDRKRIAEFVLKSMLSHDHRCS